MAEENFVINIQVARRQQIREPPSIPFLWESKPGVPIKNWKPEITTPALQPANLVASVPFIWKEKPGKLIPLLLMDHDEIYSESDSYSNWDTESIGSYMTGTDDTESHQSALVMRKTAPTLGELIMINRRMSIRRRCEEMRNTSMDMKMQKRGMHNCFNISKKVGLVDWKIKIQPMLKFA